MTVKPLDLAADGSCGGLRGVCDKDDLVNEVMGGVT